MLMKASSKCNRALVLLSMHTGMAPNEIKRFRPADPEPEPGIFAIRSP